MKRIAFYGGSFDPVHNGHLAVARAIVKLFKLDEFYFMPAFHAPHKPDSRPASIFHRYAMLALATQSDANIFVSGHEAERGEKRYSIDTLTELKARYASDRVFFVMGADSWRDITTWRRWEEVLEAVDHIVVSRPGYEIGFDHVTESARSRIVDLRSAGGDVAETMLRPGRSIFITDAVEIAVSATEIRLDASDGTIENADDVPAVVAKYIEKYELYT